MWDATVVILLFNITWLIRFEYVALSGFPFTFTIFLFLWTLKLFPESMYTNFNLNIPQIFMMLFLIDLFQTICHHASHTYLKHTLIGRSHMLHHVQRNPKPQDAFFTGLIDAFFQLILPIWLLLHIIQPSRYTAILFGSVFSWWLLFIHSDPHKKYPMLEYFGIVTPKYHNQHHKNPTSNFSNMFIYLEPKYGNY